MGLSQLIHNEGNVQVRASASVIPITKSMSGASDLLTTLLTTSATETVLASDISADTIKSYYDKRLADHGRRLNQLIVGTVYEALSLVRIIKESAKKGLLASCIFEAAAQIWLDAFYCDSLKTETGDKNPPVGHLLRLIERDFGHFSDTHKTSKGIWSNPGFKQQFFDAGMQLSGDGWIWLIMRKGKLEIVTSTQANVFFTENVKPLLVVHLCESLYGGDCPNKLADYLNNVLNQLINWEFVAKNLKKSF